MSDYKGFRIFNLDFQAMTKDTTNVSEQLDDQLNPDSLNGRLLNSNTSARYWTEDDKGLAAHLEDFLAPMIELTSNGVGWCLDTDLYRRLNSLDGDDPAFYEFKNRNPLLYTPETTSGAKTIKLVPTTYTRVMCFKHTSGYKLMVGLSLYAMDGYEQFEKYTSSSGSYYSYRTDPGFLVRHEYGAYKSYNSNYSAYPLKGGFFFSMIPPADVGSTQDDWHLEYSIRDEKFYSPTMTSVIHMMHSGYTTYNSNNADRNCFLPGTSWLHTGTSTLCTNSNSGILVGTNMKLSLMLDSTGIVGISYKYTSGSNTTYLNPMMFIGPMYKKKIWSNDTLSTKYLGAFLIRSEFPSNSSTSNSYYIYRNSAWYSASAYGSSTSYYSGYYINTSYSTMISFNSSASDFSAYSIYTAYPAVSSSVETNYRYAKAGYTTRGLLNEEVFRWTGSNGLVSGQTYNDGDWIFLGTLVSLTAEDGTTSSATLYPNLKWDGEFNGTKTFA